MNNTYKQEKKRKVMKELFFNLQTKHFVLIAIALFGYSVFSFGQNASWNYTTTEGSIGTTYSWIDCSGGTSIGTGDDFRHNFTWPFDFSFYDDKNV